MEIDSFLIISVFQRKKKNTLFNKQVHITCFLVWEVIWRRKGQRRPNVSAAACAAWGGVSMLIYVNNAHVMIIVYVDRVILHDKIKYTILSLKVYTFYVNGSNL